MPRTLQKVFGSGGWVVVVVVYSEFSVLLWSKALVLDLDQAEQHSFQGQIYLENLKVFQSATMISYSFLLFTGINVTLK